MMTKGGEPIDVIHQCQKCYVTKTNKLSQFDSMEAVIVIMQDKVKKEMMR